MKTNYKQSQAAPHAKPIFTVSRNDSTLYVLPAYLAGAVMIRLQHIADGDSPTALAALRQECPPKGSRRKITEIRHRLAAIPYPVTLELAIGSAHSAAASTLARCVATRKKYCSPTARQYALLVSTL